MAMRIGLDVEAAWAAGFFDGEGNVGFFKHSSTKQSTFYRLQVQIAQKDREVLDRFKDIVGVGKVTGPYPHKGRVNPYYRWGATADIDVEQVYYRLQPYLSSIKDKQFTDSLGQMADYRKGANARHVAAGKIAAAARWERKAVMV